MLARRHNWDIKEILNHVCVFFSFRNMQKANKGIYMDFKDIENNMYKDNIHSKP